MIAWKSRTSDPAVASYRYRCLYPIRSLGQRGVRAALYEERSRNDYRAVVFSKVYDPAHQKLAADLKGRGVRIYLDLCDNHFYNPFRLEDYRHARENLLKMIGLADQVICSTPTLAEIVVEEAALQQAPFVVGDPVDPAERLPGPEPGAPPALLWFGHHGSPNAPCGMADLLNLRDLLARARAHGPFELVVASNNRRKFEQSIVPLEIPSRYLEWELTSFPAVLAAARAVILPITRNPFTLCKTNNRIATALAAGVPVIADRIPSYEEFAPFCVLDDWESGLHTALLRPGEARRRAAPAAEYLRTRWSQEVVAVQWENALHAALAPE